MPIAPAVARVATGRRISWFRTARILFSLSPLILVHFAMIAVPFVEFSWWSVLAAFIVTRIAGLGVTVGLHRYCSHRAVQDLARDALSARGGRLHRPAKGPALVVHAPSPAPPPFRQPGDPHSPVVDGFLYGHMGWLFAQRPHHPDESVVHDLTKYPELVWLDRLWMVPGLLLAARLLRDRWLGQAGDRLLPERGLDVPGHVRGELDRPPRRAAAVQHR